MGTTEYQTTGNAARAWGVSRETARAWCEAGLIEGAKRMGRQWKIPAATVRQIASEGLLLPEVK